MYFLPHHSICDNGDDEEDGKNSIMECNTCYFNIIVSRKQTDFNVISLWIVVVSFKIRQNLTTYYLAYLNALFFLFFFVYKTFKIIYLQTYFLFKKITIFF